MSLGYPLYVNNQEVIGPFSARLANGSFLRHGPASRVEWERAAAAANAQRAAMAAGAAAGRAAAAAARRPTSGLGHPYRPGFGSTVINPLVAKRPGFGDAMPAVRMPGAVVIPKELASTVPESARIPAEVPATKEGEILALVELGDGKYAWTSGAEGKFAAPTPVAPNTTHLAIAAGVGVGLTLLAVKLLGKKR